jgi:hypothetical protein
MSQGNGDEREGPSRTRQEGVDADVLEDVLAATLGKSRSPLTDEEWTSLVEIVATYSSEGKEDLETLTIRLVESFLSIRFPSTATPPESLAAMSQWIGRTIVGDPFSRGKMQALIAQLAGADRGR